ncbi:MAG: YceI family protein [Cytophagales bacterium]|nr:YceI family protein [Cytophagales bacterium]
MKTRSLFSLAAFMLLCSIATAQNYVIDPGHSSVQIRIQRFGVVDVVGRFKDVSGSITYDANDLNKTAAEAIIKVNSYDANNSGGEEAVKSPAFLDAATYPEITFQSKSTSVEEGQSLLIGDLTIHGTTREVALPFTINGPLPDLPTRKQSIAAEASISINRQDYGVSFDRKLPNGTSLIGDEVKITLIILALAE